MTGQYHLIPISLIISLLYGVSYFFSIIGISTPKIHSRIWNFALLISFLFAGLFGIFLVIQINYKIEIPVVETIMLFHVDFGISLFLISVFHILLHLGFFKQMLRGINQADKVEIQKTRIPPASASSQFHYKRKIILSIFSLGFNSMILQIIMLREFISVFSGNELIIGIILSNWLILTGLGAISFRKELKVYKNSHFLVGLHFILGILPFVTLFLLFFLKNTFFPVGIQINYVQLYFFSLFLLAPLCFTYGFAFSSLNNQLSELYDNESVNKSYSFESFGSLVGGLIFSFLLIFILNSFQILSILLLVNLVAFFFYLHQNYNLYGKTLIITVIVILSSITFIVNLESRVKNLLFPSQNLVSVENSPYGQMIITDNSGQLNFFQNGIYVFSTDSGKLGNSTIASDEERVHFTMLQHTDPGYILCISGGISGIVKEILKYKVNSIDLVEIDPIICKLAKKYNPDIKNQWVHLINMDFRKFMQNNNNYYDIVFVNMPPPMGTETNRFYTDEFLKSIKKIMSKESYVCLSLPSTVNYIDSISLISNRLIYNTLKENFKNVCILPGEKNYFIASENQIHLNIIERLINKSVQTEYLAYYLDDLSIKSRSELMMQQIAGISPINQDLKPLSYLIYLYQQIHIFKGSYWLLLLFISPFLIMIFKRLNPIRFGMFSAGFASISAELIVIYLFQMIFGLAYQYLGLVFAIFMLGLAIGAIFPTIYRKESPEQVFAILMGILGLFLIFLPLILKLAIDTTIPGYLLQMLFLTILLIISMITGILFKIAASKNKNSSLNFAGEIYSADLYGAAVGSILVSVVLVPYAGILLTGILPGILCFISAIFVMYIKRPVQKLI